jgi:16S rRNA G966 N2-methylase RsmD
MMPDNPDVDSFIASLVADLSDSLNKNTIKYFEKDYSSIMPSLPDTDYEFLKESIKESGLLAPLLVNQDCVLLDGYHRLRACRELHIRPKYHKMIFNDKLQEKAFVIEVNLNRRHLNEFQKVELGHLLEDIETEKAKIRMSTGRHLVELPHGKDEDDGTNNQERKVASTDATIEPVEGKGKVSQIIAKRIGVSSATYERGKKIIEKATEGQKLTFRTGDIGIMKVYNQIRKQEIRDQLINQAQEVAASNTTCENDARVKLILKDFKSTDTASIPDNSVDIIFTDPPDNKEWVPNYEPLGLLAFRVLREGGSLLMTVGHYALPQVLDYIKNSGLNYWWILAIKHDGVSKPLRHQQVYVMWRPLLWFVKGSRLRTSGSIKDLIESQPSDKGVYRWDHSTVEAEHLISKLTRENDVVLDPLMGAGTTGIAALNLKRQFVGIEIDDDTFQIAEAKIRLLCSEDKIAILK